MAPILAGARARTKEWKDAESRGAAPETPKPETQRGYAGFSFHPHATWHVAPSDQPPTPAEQLALMESARDWRKAGKSEAGPGHVGGAVREGAEPGRAGRERGWVGVGILLGSKLFWSSDVFCHYSVISNLGNTSFGLHNGSCPKYYFVSGTFVPPLVLGENRIESCES